MKVVKYPDHFNIKKSSLIMGCFEVIHNGHLELIKKAQQYNEPIAMMLIEDPSLLPKSKTKKATSLNIRLEQLANLNVDYAVIVNMNEKMRMIEGYQFVKKMIAITSAKRIIIGKDFKTGFNADYKSDTIQNDFDNVIVIDFVKFNNTKISSSLIKELLELGSVEEIKKVCPLPFQMQLNFNTKKITNDIKEYGKIHSGIYACYCECNDVIYWSLFHINMKNDKGYIYAPDLKIINRNFSSKIWFHKKIRTIIKPADDYVKKNDKEMVAKYLINL